MRFIFPMFILACLGGSVGQAFGEKASLLRQMEEERAGILEVAQASVVRIHAIYASDAESEGQKLGQGFTHGTGFIFDDVGHILTVDEAVRGADEIRVTLHSGLQVPAEWVGSDQASEVAIIKISAKGSQPAPLGDSGQVRVGHYAFILGNSFGNLSPSFGMTQQVDREQDLIHILAPVQPSYGGAPVFGSTGEVVGMVWAAVDPWSALRASGQAPGRSALAWQEMPTTVYVVPINRALRIARQLAVKQLPVYGYLGIQGELDPDGGVRVVDVAVDGPAASSGIGPGDLILAYNKARVHSLWHFIYMVMTTPPGTGATMEVMREREGKPTTAQVTVGRMKPEVYAEIRAQMRSLTTPPQDRRLMEGPLAKSVGLEGARAPGAYGLSRNAGEVFRQIDQLEREIWRLREQLLQDGP
jgi:S1-C subfamily serine protease